MDLVPDGVDWTELTPCERRAIILDIQEASLQLDQVEVPIREYICNGIYAREMLVPAGTLFVGEIHRHENMSIISQGSIKVATEDGIELIESPCTVIAPAGTKRVGYALTDTVWTVLHATKLTNTESIRKEFIANSYSEYDKQLEIK